MPELMTASDMAAKLASARQAADRPPARMVQQAARELASLFNEAEVTLEDRQRAKHYGDLKNLREKWVEDIIWKAGDDWFFDPEDEDEQFERQEAFKDAVNAELLKSGVLGRRAKGAGEESDTEARFTEGPEGKKEFDAWIKKQPKSVQDEWAANTAKYKDKFDKKSALTGKEMADLTSRLDSVLGTFSRGQQSVVEKVVTEILQAWMRKWGISISHNLKEIAEDLLYNAWSTTSKIDPRQVARVMENQYGNQISYRMAGESEDDEKAQAAEERAEADQEKAQAERSEAEADRSDAASKEASTKMAYFTVVLPPGATKWQDPRKTLTRGAFETKGEADAWAKKNIPGESYKVKEIKDILPTKVAGKDNPGVPDGTGPNPDCPKKDKEEKEAGFSRQRLTWNRDAAVAPGGMYGFTKADQRDCEASIRKVQKQARKIARAATKRDPRVAAFVSTHSKRAQSLPAKILVAALQDLQPKLASDVMASDKEASRGLYGFRAKTATLGLNACSEVRSFTGEVAYGLHARRESRYASITGFFKEHGKQAKCNYSRMLLSSYPDPANGKTASAPETVEDWIAWE